MKSPFDNIGASRLVNTMAMALRTNESRADQISRQSWAQIFCQAMSDFPYIIIVRIVFSPDAKPLEGLVQVAVGSDFLHQILEHPNCLTCRHKWTQNAKAVLRNFLSSGLRQVSHEEAAIIESH